MKLIEIHRFIKRCISNNGINVLLQGFITEYQKKVKSQYFMMSAIQVNETNNVKYILCAIPEKDGKKIEAQITKIILRKAQEVKDGN